MDDLVEEALRGAALWDEVKDKLKQSAYGLSGGQQQRLCIARTIATKPDVILMDEPCSALDPIATARIEDLMLELRDDYTIVIVTHNMQQAARVSDRTAFFTARPDETTGNRTGLLVEFDQTTQDLHQPRRQAHRGLHLRPLRLSSRRDPARRHTVRSIATGPCDVPGAPGRLVLPPLGEVGRWGRRRRRTPLPGMERSLLASRRTATRAARASAPRRAPSTGSAGRGRQRSRQAVRRAASTPAEVAARNVAARPVVEPAARGQSPAWCDGAAGRGRRSGAAAVFDGRAAGGACSTASRALAGGRADERSTPTGWPGVGPARRSGSARAVVASTSARPRRLARRATRPSAWRRTPTWPVRGRAPCDAALWATTGSSRLRWLLTMVVRARAGHPPRADRAARWLRVRRDRAAASSTPCSTARTLHRRRPVARGPGRGVVGEYRRRGLHLSPRSEALRRRRATDLRPSTSSRSTSRRDWSSDDRRRSTTRGAQNVRAGARLPAERRHPPATPGGAPAHRRLRRALRVAARRLLRPASSAPLVARGVRRVVPDVIRCRGRVAVPDR